MGVMTIQTKTLPLGHERVSMLTSCSKRVTTTQQVALRSALEVAPLDTLNALLAMLITHTAAMGDIGGLTTGCTYVHICTQIWYVA